MIPHVSTTDTADCTCLVVYWYCRRYYTAQPSHSVFKAL